MPVRLSDALAWQLDAVESQLTEVRAGVAAAAAAANDVADLLRDDAERTLDAMRGHSIVSARLALGGLRKRSFGIGDDLRSTADTVSSFARTAAFHPDRLAADVESVQLRGGAVGEDGTVTSQSAVEPAVEDELDELEQSITATLRALDSLDVETSRKLALLNESLPDYGDNTDPNGDNTDPRTAIAGLVIGATTQPLGALIDASDDGLRGTRWIARRSSTGSPIQRRCSADGTYGRHGGWRMPKAVWSRTPSASSVWATMCSRPPRSPPCGAITKPTAAETPATKRRVGRRCCARWS